MWLVNNFEREECAVKFVDLGAQFTAYQEEIREAIEEILSSTNFINGPQVAELETRLASFCGARHAVAVSSGSDALLLGMMAMGVERGDEVIVPAFSFFATASMVSVCGATPVFVDIAPDTCTLDPDSLEEAITPRTRGIIPVALYGQMADMERINKIAQKHRLWVMEDAAQSFGARSGRYTSCNASDLATTSFFPSKPLGCYGDGGAVFTNSDKVAEKLKMLRNHGQRERYSHELIGINGRLDTIQAAILLVKLGHLPEELTLRNRAAEYYTEQISQHRELVAKVEPPTIPQGSISTWAQYTIRTPERDKTRARLTEAGIPTAVHYPLTIPQQKAFAHLDLRTDHPISERACANVLSLPMHPYITRNQQDRVVEALLRFSSM